MRTILITMFTLLSAAMAIAQEQTENPYTVFGDDTAMLTAEPDDAEPHVLAVPVVVADGTPAIAIFDFKHRRAVLLNADGDVLASDTIQDGQRGIWLNVDPKAGNYPHVTPYGYCVGNPVILIDPDGMRPSGYEAALMAKIVYNDKDFTSAVRALNKTEWKISNRPTIIQKDYNHNGSLDCGLQTMMFERTRNGVTEYAYAFAGTNSVRDGITDVSQMVGASQQYKHAVLNARRLSSDLNGYELTFVGHSLGGGEAAAASMATGNLAITFNRASVSEITKNANALNNTPNIVNYQTVGADILPNGIRFGGDPLSNFQNNLQLGAKGRIIPVYVGAKISHGINEFIKPNLPDL